MQKYLSRPEEVSAKNRERAMAAYLTMFATSAAGLPLPFINFFAALAFHLFIKSSGQFVAFHSYQSMLSQLVVSIINGVAVVWVVIAIISDNYSNVFITYVSGAVIFNIAYVIISLVAAYRAYKGRMIYFIFFGALAHRYAYGDQTFGLQGQSTI